MILLTSLSMCLAIFCLAVYCLLFLDIVRDIWSFPLRATLRRVRFPLSMLFALTGVICVALAVHRFQELSTHPYVPFPVTLMFFFVLFAMLVGVATEFCSRRRGSSDDSALSLYRNRQPNPVLSDTSETDADSRRRERVRLWLRRMTNQGRSTSHRDTQ